MAAKPHANGDASKHPVRITEQRWPLEAPPLVSIFVAAYNHAPFIAQCLDGILMQETTFPVEILVHDDASSDDTANIIREYESQHDGLFKVVYQAENQYSQGRRPADFLRPMAKGKYFAYCEGDDYWTHPSKLQKQVNTLENNPGCEMSIHKATAINCETGYEWVIGRYAEHDANIKVEDIITKKAGQIPTASTVIRREAIEALRDFRSSRPWLTVGDIYMHFFGARKGGAAYIDEAMSAYRFLAPESWTSRVKKSPKLFLQHTTARIDSYIELDRISQGAFSAAFLSANRRQADFILWDSPIGYFERVRFYLRFAEILERKYAVFLFPMPIVKLASRIKGLVSRKRFFKAQDS